MALNINVVPNLTTGQKLDLLQNGLNADVIQLNKEANIKAKIDSGQITATNFTSLSSDEQDTVKTVLFKNYSPTIDDVAKALSAIEFALCSLTKLFYACADKTKLTANQSTFLDSLYNLISQNNMPIDDITDWRYQYLNSQYSSVQNNRQAYFNEKTKVTGST